MTAPHVTLGNTATDIGQGANSFAAGMLAQQARRQQMALQEALNASKIAFEKQQGAHLDAQTEAMPALNASRIGLETAQADHAKAQIPQLGAQTSDLAAQAAQREHDNLPADYDDEERFRMVEPKAPVGIFRGMTKGDAEAHIKTIAQANAMKQRLYAAQSRFEDKGQITTDEYGNAVQVFPNQPGGGNITHLPGVGKPLTPAERQFAGLGQAASSAHNDLVQFEHTHPRALDEIAKAISLPNFGHLIPGIGENVSRVLQAFRLSGASPEAQAYLKRMFDFAGVVGPKRYGLRGMQNEVTLQQLWTDFGAGQFGLTPEGIAAAQKNRENAVRQLRESAGVRAWDQSGDIFPTDNTTHPSAPRVSKYGYTKPPMDF